MRDLRIEQITWATAAAFVAANPSGIGGHKLEDLVSAVDSIRPLVMAGYLGAELDGDRLSFTYLLDGVETEATVSRAVVMKIVDAARAAGMEV